MVWWRRVGVAVFCAGAATCGYFTWCRHRLKGTTVADEGPAWPRPWPHPDQWLARWERAPDVAHPAPPGHLELHGEPDRLRGRVGACAVAGRYVAATGLAVAVSP